MEDVEAELGEEERLAVNARDGRGARGGHHHVRLLDVHHRLGVAAHRDAALGVHEAAEALRDLKDGEGLAVDCGPRALRRVEAPGEEGDRLQLQLVDVGAAVVLEIVGLEQKQLLGVMLEERRPPVRVARVRVDAQALVGMRATRLLVSSNASIWLCPQP